MRIMFVYYAYEDAGSAVDILGYTKAAKALGHEILLYGRNNSNSQFNYSLNVKSVDALVFIFEWTTNIQHGTNIDFLRMLNSVPRKRRLVIDCDGNYNNVLCVKGDYNHKSKKSSQKWINICENLSDKIYQPSLFPRLRNADKFLFHGYDPEWEHHLNMNKKEFGIVYVGHSKFRWHSMKFILDSLKPIRKKIGKIGIFGHGWSSIPSWALPMEIEDAYKTDLKYLKKMQVEVFSPVHHSEVIKTMSKSIFNPVIYRPLFNYLQNVTCRTFETLAANTIPIFVLDEDYVKEIYGEHGKEFILNKNNPNFYKNILNNIEYYTKSIKKIRHHLAKNHSYTNRVIELVNIIES